MGTQDFDRFRDDPGGFAREVLGSRWWQAQTEVARLVAENRRVAVKAANGVGKTYLAADLVLWFLYCHRPSVVLTTAPTWRQVESLLWEEIRRRHRAVNARAERPTLEGILLQTRLKIEEGHFAMGLSTDEPVRFQGFHAENLLVVLDEACGVPEEIWDAVEGICVGGNNRALAISNPLAPQGRFYSLFKSPRWKTVTISALAHPNVQAEGSGFLIPGAVTREAVEDRIADWCEAATEGEAETFIWNGKLYRPNALFRSRVLGEFPLSAEDGLFDLSWIEAAMAVSQESRAEMAISPCVLAVDVARFGGDETVLAVRHGVCVTRLLTFRGLDTMEVARRVKNLALEERAEIVTIDEVGVGAGVVDRLREEGLAGLTPVNFARRPVGTYETERFLNLRAQTYWGLRERLHAHDIRLPQDAILSAQLANLRYGYTLSGQIQIESKDEIKRRGLPSPDRADALALLFGPFTFPEMHRGLVRGQGRTEEDEMRAQPVGWRSRAIW